MASCLFRRSGFKKNYSHNCYQSFITQTTDRKPQVKTELRKLTKNKKSQLVKACVSFRWFEAFATQRSNYCQAICDHLKINIYAGKKTSVNMIMRNGIVFSSLTTFTSGKIIHLIILYAQKKNVFIKNKSPLWPPSIIR